MRRVIWIASVLTLLAGAVLLSAPVWAAGQPPYKIGFVMELTGPAGPGGAECRDGLMLEVERINAGGGVMGHRVEVVTVDDGCEMARAVAGATRLSREDKVLMLVGPLLNNLEGPVRSVAEREKTPNLIMSTPTKEDRAKGYKYSWTLPQGWELVAAAQAEILKYKGFKKALVLGTREAAWAEQASALKADAAREGIQVVVMTETFEEGAASMVSLVERVRELAAKENAQAIVINSSIFSALPFIKALKRQGINLAVIGTHSYGTIAGLRAAGEEINGVLFPAGKILGAEGLPDDDPQKALLVDFRKRFRAKYNYEAGQLAANGFDAIELFARAVKAAGGPDRVKMRNAIEETTNYVGAVGTFTFGPANHEGLKKNSLAIYEIRDKKFVLLKTLK